MTRLTKQNTHPSDIFLQTFIGQRVEVNQIIRQMSVLPANPPAFLFV